MKKLLIALFVVGATLAFVGCNADSTVLTTAATTTQAATTTDQDTTIDTSGSTDVSLDTNEQVFSIEALSAANLLGGSSLTATALPMSFLPLDEDTTTENQDGVINESEIDGVDQYMAMIQDFMGSNNGLSVTVSDSDLPDYQYKVVYSTVDITGSTVEFTLYYNETLFAPADDDTDVTTTEAPEVTTTEAPEVTTADQSTDTTIAATIETSTDVTTEPSTDVTTEPQGPIHHEFYFSDGDDGDVVYAITGKIISGDLEYNVEGKHIVDSNGNEVLRLRAFVDQDNYVLVNYMTDSDGLQKFFFRNVADGELVSSSNVRLFTQDNETKLLLNITDGSGKGMYLFDIQTDPDTNTTYYHVVYNIRNNDGTMDKGNVFITATIDPTTGDIVYDYKVLSPSRPNPSNRLNQDQYQYSVQRRHQAHGQRPEANNNQDSTSM